MFWEQTAAMRIDGANSSLKKKKLKLSVRQRCVLFLDLFSLYSEIIIMRNLKGYPGITVRAYL